MSALARLHNSLEREGWTHQTALHLALDFIDSRRLESEWASYLEYRKRQGAPDEPGEDASEGVAEAGDEPGDAEETGDEEHALGARDLFSREQLKGPDYHRYD